MDKLNEGDVISDTPSTSRVWSDNSDSRPVKNKRHLKEPAANTQRLLEEPKNALNTEHTTVDHPKSFGL